MSALTIGRYSFGHFELQPAERLLLKAGAPVAIGPRAFDVLVALVERQGHLVTKEDLLGRAWPGVIVEENALHAQVSALRKLLGPEAIKTVSGSGYRFAVVLAPAGSTAKTARHNLVRQLTSFIGREPILAELKQLLRQTRLLTLSGSGGCGKTRLALELAEQVADDYADGVRLVELAVLSDAGLIPQAIAEVLGLNEHAGRSMTQTIVSDLEAKHLLLVLDSAEHLRAACAALAQTLLQRCAQLLILVTSRERLGVPGELTYRVPSLSIPDLAETHVAESLAAYESARLFIERARFQDARFSVTAQGAPAIASICAQLDGIPLAIELAAARVRVLSVEEVNHRLDGRFRLLTSGTSTALSRHRTLRALIDWSFDLLDASEKAVLMRVSVFAGGFTLEAAERIVTGESVDDADVLDVLTSLTDKNLISSESDSGETRYRQLETVRQYGRDRLREGGTESTWQRRHLEYFVELAEAAEAGLRGVERKQWMRRLEADHENLRAALAFGIAPEGDFEMGLRMAGALYPFWYLRGYWNEGRGWLAVFLDAARAEHSASARAKALSAAGELARFMGDSSGAAAMLDRSLALRRQLGDRRGISVALNALGRAKERQGDLGGAREVLEESASIRRAIGDRWGTTRVLLSLAEVVRQQGDTALARTLVEECAAIGRELGGPDRFLPLQALANLALDEGDATEAARLCREGLASEAFAVGGDPEARTNIFETNACAEAALGRADRAARIWGHAERLIQEMNYRLTPVDQLRHERMVAEARTAMGDAAFDAAWQRGHAMSTSEVIAFALGASD